MIDLPTAIAKAARIDTSVRVPVPKSEMRQTIAAARSIAESCGLEFYTVKTPEGVDVYACPEGEPTKWGLDFVAS